MLASESYRRIFRSDHLASGRSLLPLCPQHWPSLLPKLEQQSCATTFAGVVGNTINIGTGVRTTVAQVLEAVKTNVVGTTVEVTDPTPGDQNGIFADTTRIRALLGMSDFVQLADGVKRFSDFVKTV